MSTSLAGQWAACAAGLVVLLAGPAWSAPAAGDVAAAHGSTGTTLPSGASAASTRSAADANLTAAARLAGASADGITADTLALVINDNDPLSPQIGAYYQQRRNLPPENVVHVRLTVAASVNPAEFARVWSEVQAKAPSYVQGLAIAWSEPYRVDCMSITSAFAYGYDQRLCVTGCQPTPISAYFDSSTRMPYKQLGIRPAMLLAARTIDDARALIDRGVAADASAPHGTAYLLDTSDANRNRRAGSFRFASAMAGDGLGVQIVKSDALQSRPDILFYFTGVARVTELRSNKFLPGALADHLTSLGGVLDGNTQMSSLEWLEAGATASYGTVVEPYNFPGKFPNIPVVMRRYLDGETALEAYWKSVMMPAQGLFIGEPLAAPYRGAHWAGIAAARRVSVRE
jgi:uncharacterized protein (TIGR03790 family)